MNNQDYEQKERECWEELWNDLIKDKAPVDFPTAGDIFEYVFSKAYALGKQEKDAEGEEMLIVSRKRVQEMYAHYDKICNDPNRPKDYIESVYEHADGVTMALDDLFGSKCLLDENSSNIERLEKIDKPKYHKGQKVVVVSGEHKGYHGIVDDIDYVGNCHVLGIPEVYFEPYDLEPYTEPNTSHETPVCENHSDNTSQKEVKMNSNRNLSKFIVNYDKQFDNILKDSFRNERRLNVATRIMAAMLSNQMMLNNLAHGETTAEGVVKCVVDTTMMYTDALIAELEKGDSHD